MGTRSFADLSFNHSFDSRFPLTENHAALACSACHETWNPGGGPAVVRYRPLGRECSDCHDGQMDPGLRRRRRNP